MADYFTKLPRVPSPLEVMRKMGLNVPSEKGLANLFTVLPEVIGPQADIAGMVKDAKQIVPLIQSGSYGPALSSLGMATSAIPMMFLPGTVAGVKKSVKEGVGSIKGAPLYEKLNPDKFKSGTPYAEQDWDKADGWRNYVDARKTAEKDKLMAYREQGQPMPDKYRDAFAGQKMKRTPLSKKDVSDIIDDLEGRIEVRLDDGEFVEAEKLRDAVDILSKKMKASNDQFIFYTGRDAEILDSIENLADIKLRNE